MVEGIDAGPRLSCVRRASTDFDFKMKAAVVFGDDRVRKSGADREVGLAEALGEQPAGADLATGLLVIREVQLDRTAEAGAARFKRA